MTVEVTETNATRHLVEYESADLERTLASLPVGVTIPLVLKRLGARGNVWKATGMHTKSETQRQTTALK